MREFSRNYEGYPDPTVYSAITNQGCKANWKEGTVFKMPNYNDTSLLVAVRSIRTDMAGSR